MWKSIKQEFYVQRSLPAFGTALCFGSGVLGMIIMLAVLRYDRTNTSYFCLGTVMALMVGVIVVLAVGAAAVYQGFDDAVHMGKTRKLFLPAMAFVIFVSCLICLVIAAILNRAELWLYGRLYPDMECELGPEGFLTAPWLLCYALGGMGLSCASGAVIKVNRRVGGIAVMAVWLTVCWSIGGLDEDLKKVSDARSVFYNLGWTVYVWYTGMAVWMRMGVLVLVGIAGYTFMYFLLRRKATD